MRMRMRMRMRMMMFRACDGSGKHCLPREVVLQATVTIFPIPALWRVQTVFLQPIIPPKNNYAMQKKIPRLPQQAPSSSGRALRRRSIIIIKARTTAKLLATPSRESRSSMHAAARTHLLHGWGARTPHKPWSARIDAS